MIISFTLNPGFDHAFVKLKCRFFLHSWKDVAVYIKSCGNRSVAQSFLDYFRSDVLLQHQACMSVPRIMESDLKPSASG